MNIRWILIVLVSLITACGSLPTSQQTVTEPSTLLQRLSIADAAMERANQRYNVTDIDIAISHYEHALALHPDNFIFQHAHYRAQFLKDLVEQGVASKKLQLSYAKLGRLASISVMPPSYINYLNNIKANLSDAEMIANLLDVIKDQPSNAYLWNALSTLYEDSQQFWLALAAAQQANRLENDNAEYMYQLGDSINDIVQQQTCRYDEKDYATSAVKYIAKAAALNPNQLYIDNTGLQYMRLGLFPLAYQNSKKAYELQKNRWTIRNYLRISLLMGRYDEAEQAALQFTKLDEDSEALEQQAMIAVSRKQWAKAAELMREKNAIENNISSELKTRWIHQLANIDYDENNVLAMDSDIPWENKIRDYLSANAVANTELSASLYEPDYLISEAQNGCQSTEAYFYTAYRYWQNNDLEQAEKYLQLVKQQTAKGYTTYIWAGVLEGKLQ